MNLTSFRTQTAAFMNSMPMWRTYDNNVARIVGIIAAIVHSCLSEIALATWCSDDKKAVEENSFFFPYANQTLANYTGLSVGVIKTSVKKLVQANLLEHRIQRKIRDWEYTSNDPRHFYRIHSLYEDK
jgi:hypothetical protein